MEFSEELPFTISDFILKIKYQYGMLLREDFKKKNGLFNDIDQIAFNTHPPPPKDDIWKND